MTVPSCAFLIVMCRAEGIFHVQHDVFHPLAVMSGVNPLTIQIGQRHPVLGQGQRLGLELPHLRGRGCLRIACASAHNLTPDEIKGKTVGIVNVFVAR